MSTISENTLAGWTGPSSPTEQEKQNRTESMIRDAVSSHAAFDDMSYEIYAKGSYANNTNVKADSDVDIVVECQDVMYYRDHEPAKGGHPSAPPYEGKWTPERLRTELEKAITAKFPNYVDNGDTAIHVHSSSSRVDADVVPCFEYRLYFPDGTFRQGTKVFKKSGGDIENYPKLQLAHGRDKNTRTNYAYKKAVRILKRLENKLVDEGATDAIPSYLMECLVFNCSDDCFSLPSWVDVMRACLVEIFNSTLGAEPSKEEDRWLEVNMGKFLFAPGQKWSRVSAHQFASDAWTYMGFDQ